MRLGPFLNLAHFRKKDNKERAQSLIHREKKKLGMMDGVAGEDVRREAAISSTPVLRPNFKSKGITQNQLSKFQELHRKRLQIKSKSNFKKKPNDGTGRFPRKSLSPIDSAYEDSSLPTSESTSDGHNSLVQPESKTPYIQSKLPMKLHWGLDVKERWERKSNM